MGEQKIEMKTYVFQPDVAIDMMQGNITVLNLSSDSRTSTPVLVSATVKPWSEAYTEIDLTPLTTQKP